MLVIRYRSFGTAYYAGFMKTCRAIRKDTLAEYVFRKEIPLWERLAIVSVWPFPHLGRFFFKLIGN